MATSVYSIDEDLEKIRPNIMNLGVSEWLQKHEDAFSIINRILISRWYRDLAHEHDVEWRETEFDPEKIDADQINRLSCYKTLELIYLYLMKDTPEADGFEREMKLFGKMFRNELTDLLAIGINYDWDASGTIESDEKYFPAQRRLMRA